MQPPDLQDHAATSERGDLSSLQGHAARADRFSLQGHAARLRLSDPEVAEGSTRCTVLVAVEGIDVPTGSYL